MESTCSTQKIRIHDGIVGVLYLASAALAFTVDIQWLFLTAAVGLLQISSFFTGFCPVYYFLNKLMPEPKQNNSDAEIAV